MTCPVLDCSRFISLKTPCLSGGFLKTCELFCLDADEAAPCLEIVGLDVIVVGFLNVAAFEVVAGSSDDVPVSSSSSLSLAMVVSFTGCSFRAANPASSLGLGSDLRLTI